ncbi:MAG: methylated-DNA--[protein]-cysteine S-methyltransferase, partial [Ilumatobacteraceae bacterium]
MPTDAITRALRHRPATDLALLPRLRAQLAAAADADGLIDVAYTTIDSPAGPLLLAATPAGLVKIAFTGVDEEAAVLAALAGRVSARLLRLPARLDPVVRQLAEYFA